LNNKKTSNSSPGNKESLLSKDLTNKSSKRPKSKFFNGHQWKQGPNESLLLLISRQLQEQTFPSNQRFKVMKKGINNYVRSF